MLKSMTGYGAGTAENDDLAIKIEIKSVNHRYLDISLRAPRSFLSFDNMLRSQIQEEVDRGRIDVYVSFDKVESSGRKVVLDRPLAKSYLLAMQELAELSGADDFNSFAALSGISDIYMELEEGLDEDSTASLLTSALSQALRELNEARATEGARLSRDLLEKTAALEKERQIISKLSQTVVDDYRDRLLERAKELLGEEQQEWYSDQRLFAETALFADKASIDEELTRIKSHLQSLKNILQGEGPAGRQLDFLIQELNREINTIGSKANSVEISKSVVTMKTLLEQIREQVQNLE